MFDLTVSLDVTGRRCVVVGGGPEADARVRGLVHAGAEVVVVTPAPSSGIEVAAAEGLVTLQRRGWQPGDLAGAFVAYNTREDDTPVAAIWAESRTHHVLLSTLDDKPRCDFATPAVVRRGDLAITIGTAGRAPALAKRLRQQLQERFGAEYATLVEVIEDARRQVLPREVAFDAWAAKWSQALEDLDGLAALVRAGRGDTARERIVATVGKGGR
ncbi:bifunctional precorrin-2 dehydrogenase/sirohydrochlorin ferrochelatase [Egicoccus sp. AB-alg6-2]|uniref:precorrin-2 dehydrogenase/sirohydrochlorin ferrochelatase family protein n=1 Tax=Egicoccus sp. AB-alg6-2 TaxID=3242692 RepID=UPI00359D8236